MGIVDKNKQYWGALARKNGEVQRIQMMSENPVKKYKVFKGKRKITFITNADTINVGGVGNVGTVVDLWEDEYVITFSKLDHRTEVRRISVEEENLTITVMLVRIMGTLNIISSPSGANVYLNNALIGVTPLARNSLAFGSYVISLTKSGYYTATFGVNFNTHPQTVSATLNPIPVPPTPPYVPPPDPPKPPVVPGIPDPVNPPGCVNPGVQPGTPTRTSVSVRVVVSPASAKVERIELLLDGSFITTMSPTGGSFMLNNLTPGRTYQVRAVSYCVNGQSAGAGFTITMPK